MDFKSIAVRQYVDRYCRQEWVEDLLHTVREHSHSELSEYCTSLQGAVREVEPLFYSPCYAEFLWTCVSSLYWWLPRTVAEGIVGEYSGALKLLEFWRELPADDVCVEAHVLAHAFDECRHSREYFELMHAAFPGALTAQHESELRQRQPDIRTLPHVKADAKLSKPVVIDCFVRQNLGEIRTHRNLVLLAPLIVALTPAENRDQVGRIMKMLVADEIAHIAAMAHFINLWALNGERAYIQQLHRVRLAEQNAILVDEIAPHIEFLGSGAFPMLRSRAT